MAVPTDTPPREWTLSDLKDIGRKERGKANYLKAVPVLLLEKWVLGNREEDSANFVRTNDLVERLEGSGLKIFKPKASGNLIGAPTTIQNARNLTQPPLVRKHRRWQGEFWITLPYYEPLLQEYRRWYSDNYPEDYEKLFPGTEPPWDAPAEVSAELTAVSGSVMEPASERAIPSEPYDRQAFLARTYLSPRQADDLYELLHDKRQIILYGPPGTGKTYVARELAKWVTGLLDPPADRAEMIQFHPAYSYEDFVEGIRPESKPAEGGRFTVDYPPRPGVFRRFCTGANSNPDQSCVFVIDEINRGNIPRIFGELMLLLEYRDQDVALPYSGKRFQIPPNVYLIGTMNTADRSIALVDFALRRRFHFFHFGADPDLLERWLADNPPQVSYLAELYRRLSEEAIDDPDYAVGPSYFMDPNLTEQKLERIWQYSIEPYLEEYFVEQRARLNRWRWDSDFLKGIRGEK